MKKKTIEILATVSKPSERFNALFDVYRKTSKNRREIIAFNKRGVASLLSLEYSIKKHFGIRDVEIFNFKNEETPSKEQEKDTAVFTLEDLEAMNYNSELKPLAAKLAEKHGQDPASQKKVDLIDFILELTNKKPELNLEGEEKEGAKIREIYPFLGDEDCPDELKVLVADKFTAYHKWVENYKNLSENNAKMTEEEIFEVAKKAVENFELDLDIADELDYYKEHKEILGEHPIFLEHNIQKEVAAIEVIDLVKQRNNLRTYINRDTKALEEGKIDKDKEEAFKAKIEEFKLKLSYIEKRIAEENE